ncbi:pirin family protein [Actinoplanes sp. TFC3]|uniref:pirin family protein n=1 Tax=Actinoplanes sp. TFC3 TaxID=1710355 RepID=UPI000833C468|nr:pirin family protein [Actinoplanes sp. TFC3]
MSTPQSTGTVEILEGAPVALGGPRGMEVVRTLPNKHRRMVGAWCFLDAYGPHDVTTGPGMRVGPHPHIGLQTVTWLLQGEVLHRDSLGSLQDIRPGQLTIMTAGSGISHSEETPAEHSPTLQGVQLWVALPESDRHMPPAFAHHADLPVVTEGGMTATVLMGTLAGATSPAVCHTPLLGAEITLAAQTRTTVPVRPEHEYAVLALDGTATVADTEVKPGPLLYLGTGRSALTLTTGDPAKLLLLGGEPFDEKVVMWWNFVARDHEEVAAARAAWEATADGAGEGEFGEVEGYDGVRIPAPPMPITRLVPRGRVR